MDWEITDKSKDQIVCCRKVPMDKVLEKEIEEMNMELSDLESNKNI